MAEEKDKKLILLEDDLASLESYIYDLFNFSPLPICFVSPNGVMLEINPSFEEIANQKSHELIGEAVEGLFKEEEVKEMVKDTFEKGFVKNKEMNFFPKDKAGVAVQAFTKTRKDENDEVVGYFLCLFDLTNVR